MKRAVVHIIGAGAAGLAAARAAAADGRFEVVVHESAPHPGGRRRTFHDETLGLDFDTGNFPLVTSWTATLSLIAAVGARGEWREEAEPGVAFADFATGVRWRLRPSGGRAPWWLFDAKRRGPGLRLSDFWAARRLASAPPGATIASFAPGEPATTRLWRPLTLALFNAPPEDASAELASAVLRKILLMRRRRHAPPHPKKWFWTRLRRAADAQPSAPRRSSPVRAAPRRARFRAGSALHRSSSSMTGSILVRRDAVILATPWAQTAALVPDIPPPTGASATITVHFAQPPPDAPSGRRRCSTGRSTGSSPITDRLSVTIRNATARLDEPRNQLASECWRYVAALTALSDALPSWRVVASPRASAFATPDETARRPLCRTRWPNLFLAGGHIGRSLPDSIENSVLSGEEAARLAVGGELSRGAFGLQTKDVGQLSSRRLN